MVVILALAMMVSALAALAMASGERGGCKDGDCGLGEAIFETKNAITFPTGQNANFDQLVVGNDKAIAVAPLFNRFGWDPKAENNLEIIKKQETIDNCSPCCGSDLYELECDSCADACSLVNVDQIKVGDRTAIASGPHTFATNNVKIVAIQG
ncbi:MAG: hypothetical protein LUQ47_03680 [Methanotrichaceae archaeon]|nr:hypothetical protein [Methanotrichaceae archaeon]